MDAKLKSYVDRIENIEVEAKEVGTSKRDVFDEAAKAGYDKKALRRVLRDRKEAAKDKGTADLVEQYRAALGMPGATYRSVAEQTGTSKSKLQRLVPRERNGTTPRQLPASGDAGNAGGDDDAGHLKLPVPEVARAAPPVTPADPMCGPGGETIDWDALNATQPKPLRRPEAQT